MTDAEDALFETRKKKEIAELRVRGSAAMAHEAIRFLDEAERLLKKSDRQSGFQADEMINRARTLIDAAEKMQG